VQFKHNRARCIAALLESLETESDVFLAFDKLLDAGNLVNNLYCINETPILIYHGGFLWVRENPNFCGCMVYYSFVKQQNAAYPQNPNCPEAAFPNLGFRSLCHSKQANNNLY
jgi:hypothetical protein